MEITTKKINEYIKCPQKYDLLYNSKLVGHDTKKKEKTYEPYNKFLLKLMKGEVMSLDDLKMQVDIALKDEEMFSRVDVQKIWATYLILYDYFQKNQISVLSMNQKYVCRVEDNLIHTFLDIPLVKYNKTNKIMLLDLKFKGSRDESIYIEGNWYYNYLLGLLSTLKPIKDLGTNFSGLKILNANGTKIIENEMVYNKQNTIRSNKVITNVCNAIKNDIYYPRLNPLCRKCEAMHYCKFY